MNNKLLKIALCGTPNVGKSTLMNHLIGKPLGVVSPKPQTTRYSINGVVNIENTQLIFTDTPGIMKEKRNFLDKTISKEAWQSLYDVNLLCVILDPRIGLTKDTSIIIERGISEEMDIAIIINKSDLISFEKKFLIAEEINKLYPNTEIFSLSAKNGNGCDALMNFFLSKAQIGDWLFDKNQFTDQDSQDIASEVVRETIFNSLEKELPYSIHCETEIWNETADFIAISIIVYVIKQGQKKIIIGKTGSMLKKIIYQSAIKLESLLGKQIHLQLFVKVDEKWQHKML